jgi:hypothetical protein
MSHGKRAALPRSIADHMLKKRSRALDDTSTSIRDNANTYRGGTAHAQELS